MPHGPARRAMRQAEKVNEMRAMVIDDFGGPDKLHLGDLPIPDAGPGEVRVRIAYCSVNPADWKTREGMLSKYISYSFPFVLGFDLAGIVDAVGDDVTRFAKGDAVFGTAQQGLGKSGSYAEFAIAHEAALAPLSPGLTFSEAATLPTAGTTALGGLLDVGDLQAGQSVLINGGAGGVGSIAIQIACAVGARVLTTCSAANADFVRSLGAEVAIDYRGGDVVEEVRKACPQGVDLVLDAVGLDSLLPRATEIVKRGGSFVEIETLISEASQAQVAEAGDAGVRIVSNMIAIGRLPEQLARLGEMAGAGKIKPQVTAVLPLADMPEAHRRVQAGHVRGKIAIEVDGNLRGTEQTG